MSKHIPLEEIQRYGNLELLAKQVVEGFITGLHRSPFHGFSVEFSEHRLYNPGESTRHIDWKLLARSDKVFVKRYEDETNLRGHILIDASSSMHYPERGLSKLEFSVYAAACLINLMRRQRDAFGLSIVSEGIDFQSATKSTLAHQQLLFAEMELLLEHPTRGKGTRMVDSLHQLADTLHRRSMVMIFSDLMDPTERDEDWWNALQHLRFQKHEVMLFHVAEKTTEMEFLFPNRPHEFIDRETGEKIRLQPQEIKADYLLRLQQFKEEFKAACLRYGIDWNEAYLDGHFDQVLMPFMVKRAGMI